MVSVFVFWLALPTATGDTTPSTVTIVDVPDDTQEMFVIIGLEYP
jgi:hypothetical protein